MVMKLLLILVSALILIANGRKGKGKGGGGSSGYKGGSSRPGGGWATSSTSSPGSVYSSTSDSSISNTADNDYSNTDISGGWSNSGSSGDNDDDDERSIYCWETDKDGKRHRRKRGKGRGKGWKYGYYKGSKGKSKGKSKYKGRGKGYKKSGGSGNDDDSGGSSSWATTSDIDMSSTEDYGSSTTDDSMDNTEATSTMALFSSTEEECDDYNSSVWSTTDYLDDMTSTDRDGVDVSDEPCVPINLEGCLQQSIVTNSSICPNTRDTVCCNGNEYQNECVAVNCNCQDESECVPGECEESCTPINFEGCIPDRCDAMNDIVCCNGIEYPSECVAVNCNCEDRAQCVQGSCADVQPLCPEDMGDFSDVDTPCACYMDDQGCVGIQSLCPESRCIKDLAACTCYDNPDRAALNLEGHSDGLLFGDSLSEGETRGVLGGMIAGIVLIVCCLCIAGFLYYKKRNNKYGNIADIDENDGRADDIGVEGVAMTATNGRTEANGEDEDEDGAFGHQTGKTQTIIQYDSSDDDGDLALPENETALR